MALVIVNHEAPANYRDYPLKVSAGDELKVGRRDEEWPGWVFCEDIGGRQGWVPEKYVKIIGEKGIAGHVYLGTRTECPRGGNS